MQRRSLLKGLGIGIAGVVVQPRVLGNPLRLPTERLADLASRIRRTPRAEIFDLASRAIAAGASPETLLGATFLAGVHDVRPRPVGGNLHSVMVVEAAYRLVEAADSPEQAWLVALWTLDSFKATQNEESGDPWVLPPPPDVSFSTVSKARRELVAALDGWDEAAADRAIVGALPFLDRESLYEILWPYAARCLAYLGHKIVYGAMTEAVLRRIDWSHAEPTARSLVYGLVGRGRGEPLTRAFVSAQGLVDAFPESWLDGRNEPRESEAIRRELLKGAYDDAQRTVLAALRDGLGTRTIWDGIRLGAADLFLRRKSDDPESGEAIRAVHAVTELWSLGHAWETTKRERTRRLLILQAAAWVAELRDALLVREAIAMDRAGVKDLGLGDAQPAARLDEVFDANRPGIAREFLDRQPEAIPAYLATLRREVAPKGVEYHQFKYIVAIEDEGRRSDPRWASRMLAPGLGYMPSRADETTEFAARARKILV